LVDFQGTADRVWRAVLEPETVNAGLIAGDTGALLVDTGSTPEQGAELRAAAEATAGVPLAGVFITHDHYDHTGGLAAFADLPVYAHVSVAPSPLSSRDDRELTRPSGQLPGRFHVAKALDLGDRRVELLYLGPAHTGGDSIAICDSAVFAGDLVESFGPPQFDEATDLRRWPLALESLLGLLQADTVVIPGHGEPVDRDFVADQRERLQALYGMATWVQQARIPLETALDQPHLPFPREVVEQALRLRARE
jgi:glyoxylase-like metal-dependent hydrolase (beta-lactamase superfamily II)